MEKEGLDILGTLAAGIAVAHMAYCHGSRKFRYLLLVEHL